MYGTGTYSYNKYGTRTRDTSSYGYTAGLASNNGRKSSTNPITGEPTPVQRNHRDSYEENKYTGLNASKQNSESRMGSGYSSSLLKQQGRQAVAVSKQPSEVFSTSTNNYSGYGISKNSKPPLSNSIAVSRQEEEAKVAIKRTGGMY